MNKLSGKVALITGGAQGVGMGIARAFCAEGARIVITSRDEEKLKRAAADLEKLGAEVLTVAGNVRQRSHANEAVAAAVARFGRLDILVNNAQTTTDAHGDVLESLDDEKIAAVLESGFLGTLYFMQAAFPHLKKQGGSIINLGSREGIHGGAGSGIYGPTKEAIRGLSRVGAREWGCHNIRVNVLCPAALSESAIEFLRDNPEAAKMYESQLALGRFGDPLKDIGPVAVFLASDDACYLTGQTLNADGGQVMF